MHVDEVDVDASLVRRLLGAQFPQWADLPLEPVLPLGTDNALFRLGDDMVGRLSAVVDCGGLGVGDPACDVMVAWSSSPRTPVRSSVMRSRSTRRPGREVGGGRSRRR